MNTTQTLSFINTHFFIGVDVHLKNWKVTIRLERSERFARTLRQAQDELRRRLL